MRSITDYIPVSYLLHSSVNFPAGVLPYVVPSDKRNFPGEGRSCNFRQASWWEGRERQGRSSLTTVQLSTPQDYSEKKVVNGQSLVFRRLRSSSCGFGLFQCDTHSGAYRYARADSHSYGYAITHCHASADSYSLSDCNGSADGFSVSDCNSAASGDI